MNNDRHIQIEQVFVEIAADFFNRESNRTSLITVTGATMAKDRRRATILFTVLPETQEQAVLAFATRHAKDFRTFAKKHAALKLIPHFQFELDLGEKNRQRIEELSLD